MTDPQNDLLTSHDASDLLGIKHDAFRQRMNRGVLPIRPVAKLGGHWLWLRSDVETYKRNTEAMHQ